MAAQWRNKEFRANETVAGHGRERVAKEITDFLNDNGLKPGECFGSIFVDTGFPMSHPDPVACGILIYYK
jgi:hypothetical protein